MRYVIQVFGVDQWGRKGWIGSPGAYSHNRDRAEAEMQRKQNVHPSGRYRIAEVGRGETGEFSIG